ncbi:hypothetical protein BaRGS_00034655, partial [Batillaria attramentaria]
VFILRSTQQIQTNILLYFVSLLERCGDVEPNPGPMDENSLSDFLQRMEKNMQGQIKQQAGRCGDKLKNCRIRERGGQSGRNNLKFIGIRESAKQNYTACAQTIVDVLNQHSTRRTWTIDDVERAHRVGPRKGNSQQPRPLIVRFSRWPDKMAVVQGADLKQNLKDSGIKVAADLTKRQRAEIEPSACRGQTHPPGRARPQGAARPAPIPRRRGRARCGGPAAAGGDVGKQPQQRRQR